MNLDKLYEEYKSAGDIAVADKDLKIILARAEGNTGVITVLITLLYKKIIDPDQDIRAHQKSLPGGFAGRSLDTKEVTPFMKRMNFVHMATTGWLTRSLEQPHPYDADYPGKITPKEVKPPFLNLIDKVQNRGEAPKSVLFQIFSGLEAIRDKSSLPVVRPVDRTIEEICYKLAEHFSGKYAASGAARLPVLAVYALYVCMMDEIARYKGKTLKTLASHTSADAKSGAIGDIEILNKNGSPFEALEIKHAIPITKEIVRDAYKKLGAGGVSRYLILTTSNKGEDVSGEIAKIRRQHGCHVIANGVLPTIQYWLRLIDNTNKFLDVYAGLLEQEQSIAYEHKKRWNNLFE